MEMEEAAVLWGRSIEKHNFRYTYMVSDGDSKTYAKVFEMNVYGEDVQIKKLDCVGHVQKRIGKRLLNLKSVTKGKLADGKTIGGRGRLTEAIIKKIQRYYGLAIRQNVLKIANLTQNQKDVAVYQMKKNIWLFCPILSPGPISHCSIIIVQSVQILGVVGKEIKWQKRQILREQCLCLKSFWSFSNQSLSTSVMKNC